MAVVRKTDVIQVRCRPEDLSAFEEACHLVGIKPTERIRRFMVDEAALIQRRAANAAAWHATKAVRAAAAAALPQVLTSSQKSSIEAVRQPQSLSERRKAEKALKEARKRRKEDL